MWSRIKTICKNENLVKISNRSKVTCWPEREGGTESNNTSDRTGNCRSSGAVVRCPCCETEISIKVQIQSEAINIKRMAGILDESIWKLLDYIEQRGKVRATRLLKNLEQEYKCKTIDDLKKLSDDDMLIFKHTGNATIWYLRQATFKYFESQKGIIRFY